MTLVHKAVTFDCTDATVISEFWSAVLGRPIDTEPMPPSPFFASIGLADSLRIGYMFIQVPEGKTVKNRVHLDLDADDVSSEVARVIARNTRSRQGRVRHALDDPGRPRRQRVLHRHPAPLTV